ncbi:MULTISPECIES: GNAT family N-acetyltransferase [Arthrobacter]|uniref:N-acetyltransferase family protein n=1 Tax=Arthrobacter terricola TaxID=2547396 RepID=A0A4R5K965_9MICC|nr:MULTISPECIES: GNAT family N-acetyltransferase [Arthrobacter]MBT8163225.1 GNAT family N-acetyltransferase [Arthrobacter sp. GN70]TDF91516.1 N-acetyltransferase family protein [Arthrobacter terricola]
MTLLRGMQDADWPEVRRIYQEGIDTGQATFEAAAPGWASFDASKLPAHRHVATTSDGTVLGWAAVSPVSSRLAYAGVVEHSLYVGSEARGLGIGKALLQALIASTEAAGIWTIQASVFPENIPSLRLHDKAGFSVVGRRNRIARMSHGPLAGQWRDTILIERRSLRV